MRGKSSISMTRPIFYKILVAFIKPYLHSLIIYALNVAFPFFCIALCWGIQYYLDHQQHHWELAWVPWDKWSSFPDSSSILGLLGLVSLSKTRQWQERLRSSQTALFFSARKEILLPCLQPTKYVFSFCFSQQVLIPLCWGSHNPSPTLTPFLKGLVMLPRAVQIQNCPLVKEGVKKTKKFCLHLQVTGDKLSWLPRNEGISRGKQLDGQPGKSSQFIPLQVPASIAPLW